MSCHMAYGFSILALLSKYQGNSTSLRLSAVIILIYWMNICISLLTYICGYLLGGSCSIVEGYRCSIRAMFKVHRQDDDKRPYDARA